MDKPPAYSPYNPGQPPQAGFHVPPPQHQYPQYQQYPPQQPPTMVVQPPSQTVIVTPTVVTTGNCPGCRRGHLGLDFTCCGVLCAILFFPIGILCCFLMAERRCSHCRGVF